MNNTSGNYLVTLTASNSKGSDDTSMTVVVGERFLDAIVLHSYNPLNPNGDEWNEIASPFPLPLPIEPDVQVGSNDLLCLLQVIILWSFGIP